MFFATLGCDTHFKSELRRNGIDQDNLQTGIAIGFRTSYEH